MDFGAVTLLSDSVAAFNATERRLRTMIDRIRP
jgi:hypothetical protein